MFWWDIPNQLREAYQQMVQFLQQFLAASLSFDGLGVTQWLYGNAVGLAPLLAAYVAIFIIPLALLLRRLRVSGVMAAGAVMLIVPVTGLWFVVIQQVQSLGDDLSRLAINIGSAPNNGAVIDIPVPSAIALDAIITIVMFTTLLGWSVILYGLFVTYEFASIILSVAGLLLLALYGLGPRSRKAFSIVVAFSIVTMLIGRPVALAIIEAANLAAASVPQGNVFFIGTITGLGILTAIVAQPVLVFAAYRGVSSVMGRLNANVEGTVRSLTENRQKVDAKVSGNITAASNRAYRLTERPRAYGQAVASEARKAGAASAALLLAKVASNAHPATKAAVAVTTVGVKAVGSMQSRSSSKGK